METQKAEDVKDIALKLNVIHSHCPEDYYYLKGWIHCLLQMENRTCRHRRESAKRATLKNT